MSAVNRGGPAKLDKKPVDYPLLLGVACQIPYTAIMIAKELEGILVSTEEALGGAACFNGTRVHANRLFDYVLTVETLDEFLENYPEVIREHAEAVLAWERQRVREISESERAS